MRISDWSSDVCSSDLLPGMVYAVVARPPVVGGKLRSVRSDKALQVPGVLKVMDIPPYIGAPAFQALGGVAVVASNTWSAMQGRALLEMDWDDGPNAGYDSAAYRKTLETPARAPRQPLRHDGDDSEHGATGRASCRDRG